METLRIRVHLLGGQSMETSISSPLEPDEYAAAFASRMNQAPRSFITIEEIGFHTNAVAGFDIDTI
jgi:hypothetical protein